MEAEVENISDSGPALFHQEVEGLWAERLCRGNISVLGGKRRKAHVCSTGMKLWMADVAGEERLVKGDFRKIKEPVHRGLRANRGH